MDERSHAAPLFFCRMIVGAELALMRVLNTEDTSSSAEETAWLGDLRSFASAVRANVAQSSWSFAPPDWAADLDHGHPQRDTRLVFGRW
jgi:hypothetical protein